MTTHEHLELLKRLARESAMFRNELKRTQLKTTGKVASWLKIAVLDEGGEK